MTDPLPLQPLLSHALRTVRDDTPVDDPFNSARAQAIHTRGETALSAASDAAHESDLRLRTMTSDLADLFAAVDALAAVRAINPDDTGNALLAALRGAGRRRIQSHHAAALDAVERVEAAGTTIAHTRAVLRDRGETADRARHDVARLLLGMTIAHPSLAPSQRAAVPARLTETLTLWARLDRMTAGLAELAHSLEALQNEPAEMHRTLQTDLDRLLQPQPMDDLARQRSVLHRRIDDLHQALGRRIAAAKALTDVASMPAAVYQLRLAIAGTIDEAGRMAEDPHYRAQIEEARHARQQTATAPGYRVPRRRTSVGAAPARRRPDTDAGHGEVAPAAAVAVGSPIMMAGVAASIAPNSDTDG